MADRAPYDEVLRLSRQVAAMRGLLAEWCALHEDFTAEAAPPLVDLLRRSGLATLPEYVPEGLDGCQFCPCEEPPICPACRGAGASLGLLGAVEFFRCRDCGLTYGGPQ